MLAILNIVTLRWYFGRRFWGTVFLCAVQRQFGSAFLCSYPALSASQVEKLVILADRLVVNGLHIRASLNFWALKRWGTCMESGS
jgi:hypothetical protein